jgi:undecaprenyl-diphosphatase
MSFLLLFQAALLGAVEGLTEFIPVSSTGHLILLVDILKFAKLPGRIFEVVIQLGAIFAVCWLFRHKLIHLLLTFPTNKTSRHFTFTLLIAFLPAAFLGALFHNFIKNILFSPLVVSISLIVGGILILFVERFKPKPHIFTIEDVSYRKALALGLLQCLAMVPGTSRSGATIMGALLLKLDRRTATEFSFFLAIPTMLGASVYDLYKNYHSLNLVHAEIILVGFVMAFITAFFVVKHVIAFISLHGFAPFAYYRILLGVVMLYLCYA